ncbi:hypothetical protein FHS90_001889 [Rufibacter quisquiliarum]|uniref:Uncharacterized protein n=1 Tax=Rufibacter quisquiliarum TaxID=1549639 RepID=A0A839GRY0_9BACT|nr:DUF6544 family protein [Rufibacter quisquiliarum]MBA9077178.1 hypothetical protein [Rufibacter quisquiliarum]
MLIKLLSLYPVADAQGPEIDQGTLLRYLAEMVWFPSAAVSPYLSWKPVDDTHAAVTMTYAGVTATGTFTYSPAGDVTRFEALRYYDRPTGPTLEKWVVTVPENGYQTFQGIRIPAHAAITWKLKTGDFPWYQIQITGAAFNKNWHQQHP